MVFTYMSDGEKGCTEHPTPAGNGRETECQPLSSIERQKDVSVAVEAGDPGEGAMSTRSSTYFVGVGMRPGQRAEDQEHLLRVRGGEKPVAARVAAAVLVVVVVLLLLEGGKEKIREGLYLTRNIAVQVKVREQGCIVGGEELT